MGHVIGAAGGDADELDSELIQEVQKAMRPGHIAAIFRPIRVRSVKIGNIVAILRTIRVKGAKKWWPGIVRRPLLRHADAVRAGLPGKHVEGAEAHADAEAGRRAANAGDDFAQEAGAILEAAAVTSGTTPGAEELVAEVAVAVLDIDPAEAGLLREARRRDEILDEAGDLVVVEEDVVARDAELAIQQGGGGRGCAVAGARRGRGGKSGRSA